MCADPFGDASTDHLLAACLANGSVEFGDNQLFSMRLDDRLSAQHGVLFYAIASVGVAVRGDPSGIGVWWAEERSAVASDEVRALGGGPRVVLYGDSVGSSQATSIAELVKREGGYCM